MDTRLYRVSFPKAYWSIVCPVGGYKGQATTHTNLRIHSVHRHVQDKIVIQDEGNHLQPHCPACDMFFPWAALSRRHPATALYAQGVERKRRFLAEEVAQLERVTTFQVYFRPLEKLSSFKYIVRLLMATNGDWPAVITNTQKARKSWSCLDWILGLEGANTWTLGHVYVTVVQAVLLFGLELWVATPRIKRILGGFYHRVVWQILGNTPCWWMEGAWEYPPLADTMKAAGIEEIGMYISRRKHTVAQYIENIPILYLCLDMERRTGCWE